MKLLLKVRSSLFLSIVSFALRQGRAGGTRAQPALSQAFVTVAVEFNQRFDTFLA